MKHKSRIRWLAVLLLFSLLLLLLVMPAQAFDGRAGDNVVIAAGEVVSDDLYVSASTFTLDGTIEGDLIVVGGQIVIGPTGVVQGDLIAAGQEVVVRGTVADDARIAGAALTLDEAAKVGDDLIAAGYSLDCRAGSQVGGEALFMGGQAILAGSIEQDVQVGAGSLKLDGTIGGNIDAEVSSAEGAPAYNPMMFMPNMPAVPTLPPGLTIGPNAAIHGKLTYTAAQDVTLPASARIGSISRQAPPVVQAGVEQPKQPSFDWLLNPLRSLVTLLLLGLLCAWLVPGFVRQGADTLQAKPLISLLWGVIGFFAFFFVFFLVVVVFLLGVIIFAIVTLGDLSWLTLGAGFTLLSAFAVAFKVAVSYIAKIFVGYLLGRLILGKLAPGQAEKVVWPLVLGVVILVILAALPFVGWFVNLLVIFIGLGALLLLAQSAYRPKPEIPQAPAVPVEPAAAD